MSHKTRPLIATVLAALVLAFTFSVAQANRGDGNGPAGCPGMMERPAKMGCPGMKHAGPGMRGPRHGDPHPAYSAEQKQKYMAILEEFRPRMEPLRDTIFVKREVLSALRGAANPDAQAVARAAEDLVKARNAMAELHRELSDRLEKEVGAPAGLRPRPERPCGPRAKAPCDDVPCAGRPAE